MNPELKASIDAMSYESMLYRWRFAPFGDPFFQGEAGKYFAEVMSEKKKSADHGRLGFFLVDYPHKVEV